MNVVKGLKLSDAIAVHIAPGEMLLEKITEIARQIKNGVVVSGIGTLKSCRPHCVTGIDFPPVEDFITLHDVPLELVSLQGIIADGKPHIHALVSRGFRETYAGHLEDSCEVLYLAEILIVPLQGKQLTRKIDAKLGVFVLVEAE